MLYHVRFRAISLRLQTVVESNLETDIQTLSLRLPCDAACCRLFFQWRKKRIKTWRGFTPSTGQAAWFTSGQDKSSLEFQVEALKQPQTKVCVCVHFSPCMNVQNVLPLDFAVVLMHGAWELPAHAKLLGLIGVCL